MNQSSARTGKKKRLDASIIRSILRVYFAHARRYPRAALAILITSIAVHGIYVSVPWFFKKFFDTLTSSLTTAQIAGELFNLLVIIAALAVTSWALYRIIGFTNAYFEAHVMTDLFQTSFRNLMGHSYHFFADNFTGSLVRRVNRLSRAFEEIVDQSVGQLVPLGVSIIGVLLVLFQRHTLLGAVLLGWVVAFILLHWRIALWKLKYDLAKAEKDSETTGVISDALTNAITIKLFSRQRYEQERYNQITNELRGIRLFTWRIGENVEALQGALMVAIEIFLYFTWLRLWQKGVLTVGDFVLIQSFLVILFHRLWDFGRVVRRIYEACADATEMVEILETPFEVKDIPAARPIAVSQGQVEFKNVEFRFHRTRKILDSFNLLVRPGEKVALVGSSGAGKSTIVGLILRFFDVYGGEILIDGQNIACVTQNSLRGNVSLVPQEPILFHRTLMENIRYGRIEATDEEVIKAARLAHCHEFISKFPQGFDTYVGERGIKLSGGERQRVAIARAILKNAPILILDEATSSLDSKVEALIQSALRTLMKDKTAIVIAHRLSTIRQMDRILVIGKGKIVDEGTHDELIRKEGIYKNLWEIQAGGFVK